MNAEYEYLLSPKSLSRRLSRFMTVLLHFYNPVKLNIFVLVCMLL